MWLQPSLRTSCTSTRVYGVTHWRGAQPADCGRAARLHVVSNGGGSAPARLMDQRNEGVPEDRHMLFRIGINLGDILIEGDDILGDGVNVAARLEGIAEPGGICISSSAYEQVRGKVPVDFIDLGGQTFKNIARPIRAYAVGLSANTHQAAPLPSSASRLSIVVLPFANIGGDPQQDYFVDGVTESLTTDLSRINGAFVIARNTIRISIFRNRLSARAEPTLGRALPGCSAVHSATAAELHHRRQARSTTPRFRSASLRHLKRQWGLRSPANDRGENGSARHHDILPPN
jgi:hypothetical protein